MTKSHAETQTQYKWEQNIFVNIYLYSCRRTLFFHHTAVWFHYSLFHHYHLHSPFLHHSAITQEHNSHQDCIEIPSHCIFQEREFLRKMKTPISESDLSPNVMWYCIKRDGSEQGRQMNSTRSVILIHINNNTFSNT